MRVAPDEFGRDRGERIRHFKSPGLGSNLRVKDTLEEHVTQLAWQRGQVAPVQRVEGFVGFLEQERTQRRVRLLPIPRAAVFRTKGRHDADEPRHRPARTGGTGRGGGCRALRATMGQGHWVLVIYYLLLKDKPALKSQITNLQIANNPCLWRRSSSGPGRRMGFP